MGDVFVFDAVRTPRGRGRTGGGLHHVKPVSLVAGLIGALRERNPGLDPSRIDDVVLGIVTPLGDQGADLARSAALVAGLPETVGGLQINRFCASGLEAVNIAAQKIRSGWDHLFLAGGVESMSRVPMGSDGGAWAADPMTNLATSYVPQGISADLIATIEGFTRDDVDGFAAASQERAAKATANGYFDRSIIPVADHLRQVILDRDEMIRPGTTREALGAIRPSFATMGGEYGYDEIALEKYHPLRHVDHVHHAGNSSVIADGASLVLLGSEQAGRDLGLEPRARILATATSGADPTAMLTAPAPASLKALGRAGLPVTSIDLFECNEAFASVVLKFMRDLDLDHERVNVNGGAIAMGHPLGATGGMLVGTLLSELERRDLRTGLVTVCAGAGMGTSIVMERVQ